MLILFVHGALVRDADWWWHRMPAPLARYGFRTAAVELPSCVGRGDLAADAASAGRVLEVATGHHPFLADPELFAVTLRSALDRGNAG